MGNGCISRTGYTVLADNNKKQPKGKSKVMAFKTVNRVKSGAALRAEQLKGQTGFLVGMKRNVGPHKSNLYTFEDKKSGERFEVWGNAAIDGSLTGEGKGKEIDPAYHGALVRLTFQGKTKIKGRKEKMNDVKVEVDTDTTKNGAAPARGRTKSGREYRVKM